MWFEGGMTLNAGVAVPGSGSPAGAAVRVFGPEAVSRRGRPRPTEPEGLAGAAGGGAAVSGAVRDSAAAGGTGPADAEAGAGCAGGTASRVVSGRGAGRTGTGSA